MTQPLHPPEKRVAGRERKNSAQGKHPAKLLVAMTGKASAAKTATGSEPVCAYIASLGRGPKIRHQPMPVEWSQGEGASLSVTPDWLAVPQVVSKRLFHHLFWG